MSGSAAPGGLYASLRGLLATALSLLQNRLELLAVEVQEEKTRLVGLIIYGVAATLLLGVGAAFLAALVTVLLWDSNRLLVLGVFSALFLVTGGFCLASARRLMQTPSHLFAASITELDKDQAEIEGSEK